jgi:ketosteroid isomerase-like protein
MPSEDADVVRDLLDHWERGEFAPALDHLHPEVEVVAHVSGNTFEGYGGVRRLVSDWNDAFEEWSLHVEEVLECPGGGRLAVGRIRLHGKKTGAEMDRPVGLLFGLAGEKVTRIETFMNRVEEAYAAAGLERPA